MLLIRGILVLAVCLAVAPVQAAVVCVPNLAVDGSCTSSAATISAAIAAANIGGGDTVLVGNGLYLEAPIIDRKLTLQAKNPASEANVGNAAAQAIIDGNGAIYTVTVNPGISAVVIDGFEITNPTHAGVNTDATGILVGIDSPGATVTVNIRNNVIHETADSSRTAASFGELGISAFNIGAGSSINNNVIFDLADSVPPTSAGESPGSGRAQGILVKSSNGTASGANIFDNSIHDVLDVAIRFNGVAPGTSCHIGSNVIRNIGSPGTGFLSGIGIDHIGGGVISNNRIIGVTGGFGVGIQASGSSIIDENKITAVFGGNGVIFPGSALLINTSSVIVTLNLLANSAIGATVNSGASGVMLLSNCIQYNGAGLVNASGTSVSATSNWWGAVDGPSGAGPGSGDSIVNSGAGSTTTFSPWDTTPSCIGCFFQRYVSTTGSDAGNDCLDSGAPCLTIQHAVDVACDGNIINVAGGVYPEQVSIPKPLTIQGAGLGTTIVRPTSVVANTSSLTTAAPIAAIILVDAAGPVFINDLTVDGTAAAFNACSPGYIGIYYRNASGTVDTVHVTNIVHPAALGCQAVVGILAQSGNGGATDLNVTDSRIDNYGKNGITCNEAATTCDVTNNEVTGRGPVGLGDAAQNGIQLGFGATGSVVGNTVTANYYTPQTFCATGILIFSDGVLVQDNQLSNNLCDLLAQTSGSDIIGNDIFPAGDFPLSILGDDNEVSLNVVSGSVGFAVYNDGINNNYTCNRIAHNGGGFQFDAAFGGFGTGPGTPNTVNNNSIFDNGVGLDASALDPVDPPIDATNNWWGCASGPGNPGCDTVIGNADASSPLAAPPACVRCGSDADCTDNNACTVNHCDAGTGLCDFSEPVVCDDDNACTVNRCFPEMGCNYSEAVVCDDTKFCTGVETCDPMTGCQDGPDPTCNDNIFCTMDSCNRTTDICQNTPNHSACNDGMYCTGVEKCLRGVGCRSSVPPCGGRMNCIEETDTCTGGPDPSERGGGRAGPK